MRKIYLASSWRNPMQPLAVQVLRDAGHEVYDFRNPAPGDTGFAWSEIDPCWMAWDPERFARALANPIAKAGFQSDKDALDWCDTCVLLLPCGRSAHLEAGYAIGQGKPTIIVLAEVGLEPELMYLLAGQSCIVPDITQMLERINALGEVTP
jgi:nucleoside 2-deoxyribosyltransferase